MGGWLGLGLRQLLFTLPALCMAASQATLCGNGGGARAAAVLPAAAVASAWGALHPRTLDAATGLQPWVELPGLVALAALALAAGAASLLRHLQLAGLRLLLGWPSSAAAWMAAMGCSGGGQQPAAPRPAAVPRLFVPGAAGGGKRRSSRGWRATAAAAAGGLACILQPAGTAAERGPLVPAVQRRRRWRRGGSGGLERWPGVSCGAGHACLPAGAPRRPQHRERRQWGRWAKTTATAAGSGARGGGVRIGGCQPVGTSLPRALCRRCVCGCRCDAL